MRPTISTLLIALFVAFTSGCIVDADDDELVGNADVFSVNEVFDLDRATFSGTVASMQYNDFVEIKPSVVDQGTVLVYYRFAGTWTAMPYTISVEAPDDPPRVDYAATFAYAYSDAFLEVFVESSTDDPVVWDEILATDLFGAPLDLKIVIIDALPVAAKKGSLDLRDYEAVKAYYGLED